MDKELQEDLSQMTMYSKMGKYISNKILKYNKKSCNTHRQRSTQPPIQYSTNPKKIKESLHTDERKNNNKQSLDGPPVGYYKVNHNYVEKNPRTYNFNRSVPHFCRNKYFCHESEPALKDYPDLSTSAAYTKGLVELKRVTGRDQIKGSIRKFIEDPHENRFKLVKGRKIGMSRVNM